MVFEYYCALCGVAFAYARIGSTSPRALKRRRRRVERKREALNRGDAYDSDSSSDAEDCDEGDGDEGSGEDSDWSEEMEDRSYDPGIVTEEDLDWLSRCCCLGFNPSAAGGIKAFVSGRATSVEDGCMEVEDSTDPNQPPAGTTLYCYYTNDPGGFVVFPFHNCCFKILLRAIGGTEDMDKLNKDVLYEAMSRLTKRHSTALDLDYGDISGQDQVWKCIPGEEYSVANPAISTGSCQALSDGIASIMLEEPPRHTGSIRHPVGADPFAKLPIEILQAICRRLSGISLLSFLTASWFALSASQSNDFWKLFIGWDMPWLWELPEVLEALQPSSPDYKALYMWLEHATRTKYGMSGPFIGFANRRRIWLVCQELANRYAARLQAAELTTIDPIRHEYTDCAAMPFISRERASDSNELQTQMFAHSWGEILDEPSVFLSFWGDTGALVGLGVEFGTSRRIFGTDDTGATPVKKAAVQIGGQNWISSLLLYITATESPNESASPRIVALGLNLDSGPELRLGSPVSSRSACCKRLLAVRKGKYVVGISGCLDKNGDVSRLGLLGATRTHSTSVSAPSETLSPGHPLWAPLAPQWLARVDYSLAALHHDSSAVSLVHDDLIPHERLTWGPLNKLERISFFVTPGNPEDGCPTVLVGMRAQFIKRFWEPKRYVGMRRNTGYDEEIMDWPDSQLIHFDIDGPGGEFPTEIGVAQHEGAPLAFMLKTNKGRELRVGNETNEKQWVTSGASEQPIHGLIAAFTGASPLLLYPGLSALYVLDESG